MDAAKFTFNCDGECGEWGFGFPKFDNFELDFDKKNDDEFREFAFSDDTFDR